MYHARRMGHWGSNVPWVGKKVAKGLVLRCEIQPDFTKERNLGVGTLIATQRSVRRQRRQRDARLVRSSSTGYKGGVTGNTCERPHVCLDTAGVPSGSFLRIVPLCDATESSLSVAFLFLAVGHLAPPF